MNNNMNNIINRIISEDEFRVDSRNALNGRLLSEGEGTMIWEVLKTCDFARDNLISISDEKLMQMQFDAHAHYLGFNRSERLIFNRICCLVIGIKHSFLDYKTLINKLLMDYSIQSLYGIFRKFESDYMKQCKMFDSAGKPALTMFELALNSYAYVKNELVLYVEMWFEYSKNISRNWNSIWHIYTCTLESLIPVDFNSTSIGKACKRLFGESEKKLEKHFGGTAFWLAVKCILSHKLRLKQPEIQRLFSPEYFFAAKAFIAIYPTMKVSQKRRFIAKDKYDKTAYMLQVLMHSKAQSKLFKQYLNTSALILNKR